MAYLEFIKLALFAITRNKTRAFLTMLGIMFSVPIRAAVEAFHLWMYNPRHGTSWADIFG